VYITTNILQWVSPGLDKRCEKIQRGVGTFTKQMAMKNFEETLSRHDKEEAIASIMSFSGSIGYVVIFS